MTPSNKPPAQRKLNGLGIAAIVIIVLVVAIFVGYNAWYMAEASQ